MELFRDRKLQWQMPQESLIWRSSGWRFGVLILVWVNQDNTRLIIPRFPSVTKMTNPGREKKTNRESGSAKSSIWETDANQRKPMEQDDLSRRHICRCMSVGARVPPRESDGPGTTFPPPEHPPY